MKLASLLFTALAFFLQAGQVQAATWHSHFECFVKIHYSANAFGRPVRHVMAHLGVEQLVTPSWSVSTPQTEWVDVKDVHLQPKDNAFLGEAVLKGEADKLGPAFQQYVIQYWVTFEDGDTLISPVYPIQVQRTEPVYSWEDYEKLRTSITGELSLEEAWTGTRCQQIEKITRG